MGLLRDMPGRGYPPEYVLARIRGRRGHLAVDWRQLLLAPEPLAELAVTRGRNWPVPGTDAEVWGELLRESAWLYAQLGPRLRPLFAPLLLLFELRTVLLCLRRRQGGDGAALGELLGHSLLAPHIKKTLEREYDVKLAVEGIAAAFGVLGFPFRRLGEVFRERGLAGFEERLTTLYLERAVAEQRHPLLAEFFRRLVDRHNLLALAKSLRWGAATPPVFVSGGSVPARRLAAAAGAEERETLAVVRRLAGGEAELAPETLEPLMLSRLGGFLHAARWQPDGVGAILDYLWGCRGYARNLSLLLHGARLDRDLLAGVLLP